MFCMLSDGFKNCVTVGINFANQNNYHDTTDPKLDQYLSPEINTRTRKIKRWSDNWVTDMPIKKRILQQYANSEIETKYCICQCSFQPGRDMIQCDKCEKWYHFDCLNITGKIPRNPEKSTFYCGLENCNKNCRFLKVYSHIIQDWLVRDQVVPFDSSTCSTEEQKKNIQNVIF